MEAATARIEGGDERTATRRRLERQGHRVSYYVLVDPTQPDTPKEHHGSVSLLAYLLGGQRPDTGVTLVPAAVIDGQTVPLDGREQADWQASVSSPPAGESDELHYDEVSGTGVSVELGEYGLAHSDRVGYQPTNWRYLPIVFENFEVGEDEVFLDFGCGKGRMLLEAAMRPFARVIGVEISPDLAQIARGNVERNRERLRTPSVEVVVSEATAFQIPDEVTVAYFYNPFRGATFKAVLTNLLDSLARRPRRMRIIYLLPAMHDSIMATGRFKVTDRVRFGPAGIHQLIVYQSHP